MRSETDPVFDEYKSKKGTKEEVTVSKIQYASSPARQLRYVMQCAVRNVIRNPQATIMQVVVMIIFAVLVGVIYFQIDDSAAYGIQNR